MCWQSSQKALYWPMKLGIQLISDERYYLMLFFIYLVNVFIIFKINLSKAWKLNRSEISTRPVYLFIYFFCFHCPLSFAWAIKYLWQFCIHIVSDGVYTRYQMISHICRLLKPKGASRVRPRSYNCYAMSIKK